MIFRRKAAKDAAADAEQAAGSALSHDVDELDELGSERPHGPWDRTETNADENDPSYLDLGGLVVRKDAKLELRLGVNNDTSAVTMVMLAGVQSGLELRAFAAPRGEGIWADLRKEIAAKTTKEGGTATELDGEFGTELKLVTPATAPDGRRTTQTRRIVGVEGPRWLLRGTFLGKSALQPDPDGLVESAFRDVIVVRGPGPMAPRDLIPMQVPTQNPAAVSGETTDGDDTEDWSDQNL